jgi:dihydroneopterin aldolase
MASAGGVTVVKIGGSLTGAGDLQGWLAAAAACAGRIILVPGGGPFADAVRIAQPKLNFDDRAAHQMAVLAMEQFGCALASLHGQLKLAPSVAVMRRMMRDREVPVWLPARMVLAAREIPASWDVTSDSLAAWLAGKIGAERVLLVKRVELRHEPVSLEEAVSRGVADRAFPWFLRESGASAVILGASSPATLAGAVDGAPRAGARITLP